MATASTPKHRHSNLIVLASDLVTLRRRFAIVFAFLYMISAIAIALFLTFLPNSPSTLTLLGVDARLYVWGLAAITVALLVLALRGQVVITAAGLIALLVVAGFAASSDSPSLALVSMIVAAVLGNRRAFVIVLLILCAKLVYESYIFLTIAGLNANGLEVTRYLASRLILVILALIVRFIVEVTERTISNASRAAVLLRTSAEIGTVTSQIADLNTLFNQIITLVQERFGFYHVQIFIVNDTGDQAVLRASTGDIGRRLLSRRHQLAIGSQSVIGQVTLRGEPVIARDADRDEVHFRNELLINTRSELAVPVREGAAIIGALDVQSAEPDAFDQIDIEALQVIADFIGSAVRNTGAYEEQTRTLEQNQRLLQEAEENIRLIQRLNRELTRTTWEEFSRSERPITGVEMQNSTITPLSEPAQWSPAQQAAARERQTITQAQDDRNLVAVPLTLRGEVIGTIEVESGAENDPSTVSMIEDVAQRLAISLENARLYEESRDATAQEQFINSLAARYQSVTSVDDLLRLTLVELSETLGAQKGSIRLGKLELESDAQPKNGVTSR